jgi:hypothetical protein
MNAIREMRKRPELIPLFVTVGAGLAMAAGYVGYVMTNGHMLSWSRYSYPWLNVPQTKNTKFMGLQTKKEEEVFKPQASDDLRGKI